MKLWLSPLFPLFHVTSVHLLVTLTAISYAWLEMLRFLHAMFMYNFSIDLWLFENYGNLASTVRPDVTLEWDNVESVMWRKMARKAKYRSSKMRV